jgi:hypothetical protein
VAKLTKIQQALKASAPQLDDETLDTLRLIVVMKKAIEDELIESATDKNVVLDVRRIVDAHIQSIAYWMCASSIMDDKDSMVNVAREFSIKLLHELPHARAAWKQNVAENGLPDNIAIVDENLMDKSVTNPTRNN